MGISEIIRKPIGKAMTFTSCLVLAASLTGCVSAGYLRHNDDIKKKRDVVIDTLAGLPYNKDIVAARLNEAGFKPENSWHLTYKFKCYYITTKVKGLGYVDSYDFNEDGIIDKREIGFK